jgi:hypothetical protein
MSLTGHVQDGQVVFDAPNSLPNGTAVTIELRQPAVSALQPEEEVAAQIAGHEMLRPWTEMPFEPVLTVVAHPGALPLPDPPVIPEPE